MSSLCGHPRTWLYFILLFLVHCCASWANITNWKSRLGLPFQVCSLIAELASAAAAEKGIAFENGMEDRLCAYSRAVAHFPTAVKEVNIVNPKNQGIKFRSVSKKKKKNLICFHGDRNRNETLAKLWSSLVFTGCISKHIETLSCYGICCKYSTW